ncbi:phenylalanine--tRNA ligase subunit alpha [bacterium]|nr:MAG: phenylalanine--tRNA ligase subunit alpha [bacterium]
MSGVDIEAIEEQVKLEIPNIDSRESLEVLRVKYLGRKGILAELTARIPSLPIEKRRILGQQVNALKNKLNLLFSDKEKSLAANRNQSGYSNVDMGLPGIAQDLGRLHPLTQVIDEICGILTRMGFSVVEGPEIESEYNNFSGLNIPLEHPSRDVFDTFYLRSCDPDAKSRNLLLRSQTSPMQIRMMKTYQPPLAVAAPGRVYRPDATDASHSFMFHQIEGFMVDKNIRFSDLKGVLELLAKSIFSQEIRMRFRPHFFPFTEPSAEVDISCIICQGKGCSVCARKGWLEILGSGMIHPNVFKNVGYDPKKYTGFAFGLGIERIAMLKFGINDIRLFFENDLRFLKQF